jgi:putative endonuclease
MHYIYLIKSLKHGQTYTGYTMDLKKRFDDHNKGLSKYTSLGIPWELVYYEAYASKVDAQKRERSLKLRGNAYAQLRKRLHFSIHES